MKYDSVSIHPLNQHQMISLLCSVCLNFILVFISSPRPQMQIQRDSSNIRMSRQHCNEDEKNKTKTSNKNILENRSKHKKRRGRWKGDLDRKNKGIGFVCQVLWHFNHCRLFNAKSSLYIYIKYIGFGLVLWHINHCRLFNTKSSLYINIKCI